MMILNAYIKYGGSKRDAKYFLKGLTYLASRK